MTIPPAPGPPAPLRLTPVAITLLALAALAWAGVVGVALDMGNGPGTMGLGLGAFLAMWALMMAAMMLPAVAPVASLYAGTVMAGSDLGGTAGVAGAGRAGGGQRRGRPAVFVAGYLAVWAAAGLPVYALLRWADHLAHDSDGALRTAASVVLITTGAYQLSPLKDVCLRHCRSPLGQLLHYSRIQGRLRELKVALHHAAYCLGCCWGLMALFLTFGVMNVWAMLGLATVVVAEKTARRGETIGRAAGVACVVLAVVIACSPTVARVLVPDTGSGMGGMRM